ncbi:helix-turn-helix domain-containing protein [Candidatus Saccharibacteria bacterium]|nr:helix-turn-helix domain-containing protein [Candidatus Saccharibacteria bacterium]
MDELFTRLGFSDKEANCYKLLLENGHLTASRLSKLMGESRTNTYMILERLEKEGLVEADESESVRQYVAVDPVILKQLVTNQQLQIKQTQQLLQQTMPELRSQYNLSQLKPGVVYLEGLKGLEIMLDDMAKSKEEALLIPGGPVTGEAWETLKTGIAKRAKLGVKTRVLFTEGSKSTIDPQLHKKQKYEVRYWEGEEYPGELVVYGNKCVFTAYEPNIINTILTNDIIAKTMRGVFEGLWANARP